VIAALAIAMGRLFVTTYSLALADPVPHRIDAALVGDRTSDPRALSAVEQVAGDSLMFRPSTSIAAARHAIDEQDVYAALDLTAPRPVLYNRGLTNYCIEAQPMENMQFTHLPQAMLKGRQTQSPTCRRSTSSPTSTTWPRFSCPNVRPGSKSVRPSYMCRSEPQMFVVVIRTIASDGRSIRASSTSVTATSRGPS
jgi:hypothetical protein